MCQTVRRPTTGTVQNDPFKCTSNTQSCLTKCFSPLVEKQAERSAVCWERGSLLMQSRGACSWSAQLSGLFPHQSELFQGQLFIPDPLPHGNDGHQRRGSRMRRQFEVRSIKPVANRLQTGRGASAADSAHPPLCSINPCSASSSEVLLTGRALTTHANP